MQEAFLEQVEKRRVKVMDSEEQLRTEEERMELIFSGKLCPYCNGETKLIDSKDIYRNGVSYGYMYICPKCGAYVGCHRYTKRSLGSVANEELRLLRHRGHHYFDQIWRRRIIHRPGAYKWLSEEIGTDLDHTHFGMFNEEQCRQAIAYSLKILAERKKYIYAYDEADFKYINEHFSPVYAVMGQEQNKKGILLTLKEYFLNMTSRIVVLAAFISLLAACTHNTTKKEDVAAVAVAVEPAEPVSLYGEEDCGEDSLCSGDLMVYVDSLHHVSLSDTLEGYEITAEFVPDTAYSENVGHIEYTLSDIRGRQTIATTYNHFYAKFNEEKTCEDFSKDAFLAGLNTFEYVPFKFLDVDFDGIREFLVVHEGYNRNYYEVFKKNGLGLFRKVDVPPYDQLVNGHAASTEFDRQKKTIRINEHLGVMTSHGAVYQLRKKGSEYSFECVEKSLMEQTDEDSLETTTWELVDGQLQIVSKEKCAFR